ncbi:MAG TPA: peptidylprolyl isomerase [Candidatus Angelobacter sp.]|nr:peptidylprolyl isomerase [Candidatus Angelobacter sp.]
MKRNIMIIAIALALGSTLPAQVQNQNTHLWKLTPAEMAKNTAVVAMAKPVERVNGTVLTEKDLLREMYSIFPYARQHNGFPKAMEAEIRRGALMMITFEELVYQEALRRKMTVTPERLATAQREFRKQFASDQQYQEFVQAEANGSARVMRTRIRRSLLIEDLLKAEITTKSSVTLAEAKAFYLKNPKRFQLPDSYTLQTITVMPPSSANPKQAPAPPTAEQLKQMKTRADEALQQAKAAKTDEEFGLVAEKISEDDYRVMMGKHRPMQAAQLPPEILKAASQMQPGQISGLIQAEGAYTIIRLNGFTPARMQRFAEVSSSLRTQMQRSKAEQLRQDLDKRLRKNADIEQL